MGRRAAREVAMTLLYQLEMQKGDREEQINDFLLKYDLSANDKKYILDVLHGVNDNIGFLDDTIEKNSKGWTLSRISRVDLSILRLSIYELYYMADVPTSVSINEAVNLAKKFCGEESGAFVNGILGKINAINNTSTKEQTIE